MSIGTFDVSSDSISVGDPVMGMTQLSVKLAPGSYVLRQGALQTAKASASDSTWIELDGPYLFVVDSSKEEEFEDAFHAMDECGHDLAALVERKTDIDEKLGTRVGFYWENEIAGAAREGNYVLDVSHITSSSG